MADGPGHVKRRKLPARHACNGCKKRKQRCDGERPACAGCRCRWLPCEYPLDATRTIPDDPTVAPGRPPPSTSLTPSSSNQLADLGGENLKPLDNGIVIPHTGAESKSGAESDLPSNDPDGAEDFYGESSSFSFVSKVQPESQSTSGIHFQEMELRDSSLSRSPKLLVNSDQDIGGLEAAYGLPERQLADGLVDRYFNRAHPLYPFVHETTFRADYENAWINLSVSSIRPSWYALLNIIFALGCEFNYEIPVEKLTNTVSRFVANSRCIILSHIYKKGNLEFVQALLLLCHYLQGTLRLNECWNLVGLMIRTAFSIGLQLDPKDLPLPTVVREMRKRVWWGCFIIDQTVSMKFGRPPSIQASDAEAVPLPLAVDDQYINNQTTISRQPTGRPSITAFFVHTIKLSRVIESVLKSLYNNKRRFPQPTDSGMALSKTEESNILSNVILHDGHLQSWWREAPAHLSQESIITDGDIVQRQRNVLHIRYLQIRILIQRPLLLMVSRQPIEDGFYRAIAIAGAQTCMLAAQQTVRMICDLYHRGLLNSSWYNLYYMFTSIGVLLHIQTMDRSMLALLGNPQDQKSIECGMEFLKAAAKSNSLASRYTAMLSRVLDKSSQSHRQGQQVWRNGPSSRQSSKDREATGKSPTPGMPAPAGDLDINAEMELDAFVFDDLLFETGYAV